MAGLTTGGTVMFWGLVLLAGAAHNRLACCTLYLSLYIYRCIYMHGFILHMHLPFPLLNINVVTPTFRLESQLSSIHSKTDMKWIWKFAGKQSFWIGNQTRCISCTVLFCKD